MVTLSLNFSKSSSSRAKTKQAVYTDILVTKAVKIGSFYNDDGDGNEDVKKTIGLLRTTTALHVHHAFLYISLPSLDDYDVKMPNCKFYGGRKQATMNFFFSL